jgi:hypothetical protein
MAGCGSDTNPATRTDGPILDGPEDAAQQDGPPADVIVPHDTRQLDATVQCAFNADLPCDREFQACTTLGTSTSECGGLDCVRTPFGSPLNRICLRPCPCTDACQESTFCLPKGASNYQSATFASMGGHCLWSFCGGGADSASWYGNGLLLGNCELGGESYLKSTFADRKPGTCHPITTTPSAFGQCLEAGSTLRGGSCPLPATGECQARTGLACKQGSLCVGTAGESTGKCGKLCDPHAGGFDPTVPGSCAADGEQTTDQFCQDSSSYTVAEGTGAVSIGYVGYCIDEKGCDSLSTADDCSGTGAACAPTSSWWSNGACDATAGSVTVGGVCSTSPTATPEQSCVRGSICVGEEGVTTGACRALCGRMDEAAKKPCAGGYSCDSIPLGTATTRNWGACIPTGDGGVVDGGTGDGATADGSTADGSATDGAGSDGG